MALKKPIPSPFFVLPETLIAFNTLTSLGTSADSFSSKSNCPVGALPTRLEKNKSPFENKSTPSVKNWRCSEKVCSKGPRLSTTLSKPAWLKSGTSVASKVKLSVIPYFTSIPKVKSVSVLPSKLSTIPVEKG